MKKALQLASVASMIDQFTLPNIRLLQALGYSVDVAADFTNPGNITINRAKELKLELASMGVTVIDVHIPRALNPILIYSAYKTIKERIQSQHYDLIHCHSPIGGAIARFAAKKERTRGTKVIYTAHGFHFYDGAPIKNWMIFYPVEKHLSKYTDVLITINDEDYIRATKQFKSRTTTYVPGIGVDVKRFRRTVDGRERIREELNINNSRTVLLSVGELNKNKNHEVVIKAIRGLDITYVIVGKGELDDYLRNMANDLEVDLRLMGYRSDVNDFYSAADVYILPSLREGLNVSLMEAMANGLPVVCGKIRGNTDLIDEEKGGYLCLPTSEEQFRYRINCIMNDVFLREKMMKYNTEKIVLFDRKVVNEKMEKIYSELS